MRLFLTSAVIAFLKVVITGGYAVWASRYFTASGTFGPIELGVLLLSIYGLWVIIGKAASYIDYLLSDATKSEPVA